MSAGHVLKSRIFARPQNQCCGAGAAHFSFGADPALKFVNY